MAERAGEADVVVIDDGETKSSCGSEKWVEQLVRQLDARQRGESASGAPGPKRRRKDHRSKDKPGNGTGFGGEHAAKEAKRDSQLRAEKELVERENDESIGRILSSLGEALQVSGEPNRIMADMRGSPGLSLTLQRLLRNECLLDVGRRAMAYTPLLSFLSSLARRQEFWPLLLAPLHKEGWGKDKHAEQDTARHPNLKNPPTAGSIPDDDEQSEGEGETVCGLLRGLQVQAKLFVSMCESSANVRSGEGEGEEEYMAAMAVCLHVNDVVDSMNAAADAAGGAGGRASGVCNTAGGKERVGEKRRRWQGRARDSEQAGKQKEEDGGVGMAGAGQAESDAEAYVRVMSPRKFAAIALLPMLHDAVVGFAFPLEGPVPAQGGHAGWMGGFRHSGVGGHLGGARVVTAKGRTVRIASEVASLAASLPVQFASSIFVRVDETRPDVIKALISGPEDTPYAHGLFEFDIRLPDDYPQRPPLVKLLTTGNGTVRFNPNLYQDGKVCLSLLGTWSGPGWHPETSTLLQVLVSVQALIMVPDPCFNEPGHEALRNKPGGNSMSASYNLGVWENNVRYALLGAGKRPSPVFKEVIERHLVLKRRAILQDCEKWEAEANRPVLQAPWLAGVRQGRDGIWAVTKELRAFLQGLDPNLLEESEDDQEVKSEVKAEVRAGRGEDGEEPLVPRHAVDAVVVDDDEDGSVGAEAAATSRMAQSRGVVSVPDECIVLD